MRILILPSWYPPEGGWFFRDQALSLLRLGHDVSVLYAKPRRTAQMLRHPGLLFDHDLSVADEDGLRVYRSLYPTVRGIGMVHPLAYARECVRAFRCYQEDRGVPDVIHAHSSVWAGYAASCLARQTGIPYVITEHRGRFTLMSRQARHLVRPWFPLYLRPAFLGSSGVMLVGSLLDRGLGRYQSGRVPWEVISNGVDTAFFFPASPPAGQPFTFVFVGTLAHHKGPDLLISAFSHVAKRYPGARLLLIGSGPERPALERLRERAGLAESVSFAGQQDREGVRRALHAAHVFVLPTRHEAQGVVYLEAMACGLPIIGTDAAPPEVFPDFAGIRVPSGDVGALAEAMCHMHRSYATYDRGRIRRFAVTKHDHAVVARKVLGVYSRALDIGMQHDR